MAPDVDVNYTQTKFERLCSHRKLCWKHSEPMHGNHRIDITVASQTTEVACSRMWAVNGTTQRINLHAPVAVYHRHVQPQTTEGNVNEFLPRRSLDAVLTSLGQLVPRGPLIADERAKRNLAAIVGDASYAAGVGPSNPPVHGLVTYRLGTEKRGRRVVWGAGRGLGRGTGGEGG